MEQPKAGEEGTNNVLHGKYGPRAANNQLY